MPPTNKNANIEKAFNSVRHIKQMAVALDAFTGPIPSNVLEANLDSMLDAHTIGVVPFLALPYTPAQINSTVGTFQAGAPADTVAAMTAVGTALTALFNAYAAIFPSITFKTYSPATGHGNASVAQAQLQSLSDELNGVLAAVAPLT